MSLEARLKGGLKGFLTTTQQILLRSALGLSLAVMPTLYNCGSEGNPPQSYGCQSDSECKGGLISVKGECVYPEEKPEEVYPEEKPEEDVFIGKDVYFEFYSRKDTYQPTCIDKDGDGYGIGPGCLEEDCDDADSSVYPGAEEICDGLDNDCDGDNNCLAQIPEECIDDYGACSCFLDPQTIINEGAIDLVPSEIKVHDGDTVKDNTTNYRFSAVDAAEVAACIDGMGWSDQFGIGDFSQINYGQLGKEYVDQAIHNAQSVQAVLGKIDDYGRRLAYFIVDGQLLQCLLVREGLAWETISYYGLGSHPPLAQVVLDASEIAGEPNFIEPYLYKQEAQPCQE